MNPLELKTTEVYRAKFEPLGDLETIKSGLLKVVEVYLADYGTSNKPRYQQLKFLGIAVTAAILRDNLFYDGKSVNYEYGKVIEGVTAIYNNEIEFVADKKNGMSHELARSLNDKVRVFLDFIQEIIEKNKTRKKSEEHEKRTYLGISEETLNSKIKSAVSSIKPKDDSYAFVQRRHSKGVYSIVAQEIVKIPPLTREELVSPRKEGLYSRLI